MKQDITDYTVLSNCNMKVYLVLENLFFIIKVVDSWSVSCAGADPGFGQGGGPQVLRPKVADVAKRAICGRGPGPA